MEWAVVGAAAAADQNHNNGHNADDDGDNNNNVPHAGGGGGRSEEQRKRSTALSYLLRHAPAKLPELKQKLYRGGYISVFDILPYMRKTTKEQVVELVASSKSQRGDRRPRFQLLTLQDQDYIRATYGHTFDVSMGRDIGTNVGTAASDAAAASDHIPSLMSMLLSTIISQIEAFQDHFGACPDGNLLTAIFNHLKKTRAKPIGTKLIKPFLAPALEHLDLSGLVVEQGVYTTLVSKCPNLKSLNLDGCFTCMTDTNLELVARRLRCLKRLDLSACRYITDMGITSLEKHSHLTHLSLRFVHRISVEGLKRLLEALAPRGLEMLDISGCTCLAIHPLAFKELSDMFPRVVILNSNAVID